MTAALTSRSETNSSNYDARVRCVLTELHTENWKHRSRWTVTLNYKLQKRSKIELKWDDSDLIKIQIMFTSVSDQSQSQRATGTKNT